ncbi:hypothetical protein FHL15_002632 [Xylaria flabelliformis]|uniref:Uncharacterized protein n=1 Tax=Xylaria flabelliformis TaxID=2512241 RepID=A0A553I832_9PEZI|nr:hypothetical protein FHL15_002632 [Xylaria flabelliformis]
MSSRRERIYAERRRARYEAAQAALSPEQLEEQNTQNKALSNKLLARITASQMNGARMSFLEYMGEEHLSAAASDFFSPGAQLPDVELLKAYAPYLSRSRISEITDVITRASVFPTQHMSQLFAIIRRESQPDDSRSGHFRVVRQELFKLYDSEYLDTFRDMRMVLNLTLYMCLLVDKCGRGAELAWNMKRPKHMHLKWEEVEFITFQCAEAPDPLTYEPTPPSGGPRDNRLRRRGLGRRLLMKKDKVSLTVAHVPSHKPHTDKPARTMDEIFVQINRLGKCRVKPPALMTYYRSVLAAALYPEIADVLIKWYSIAFSTLASPCRTSRTQPTSLYPRESKLPHKTVKIDESTMIPEEETAGLHSSIQAVRYEFCNDFLREASKAIVTRPWDRKADGAVADEVVEAFARCLSCVWGVVLPAVSRHPLVSFLNPLGIFSNRPDDTLLSLPSARSPPAPATPSPAARRIPAGLFAGTVYGRFWQLC